MFGQYYFTKLDGNIIYYVVLSHKDKPEMSLYVNEKLVDRIEGLLGDFELTHENILLRIHTKLTKSTQVLKVGENIIPLKKVKKKELKKVLSEQGIFNEINPSKEEREKNQVKLIDFIFPIIVLIIGALVYLKYGQHPKFSFKAGSFLILALGTYLVYNVFANRYPIINLGKLSILVGLVSAFGLTLALDFINYGTNDLGELYGQLNTEKSNRIKVRISEVSFQDVIRYKRRARSKPFYNNIYQFRIDNKIYEGNHKTTTSQFTVGDSIEIFYLIRDPRINKSVENASQG